VFVPRGADSEPWCEFVSDFAVVGAPTNIAEFASDVLPLRAVGCVWAGDRVRYLVQQNLVNLVVVELGREIARN